MRVAGKSEKVLKSTAHLMSAVLRQAAVQGEDRLKKHLSPKGDECLTIRRTRSACKGCHCREIMSP